jgi:hypothetical protein
MTDKEKNIKSESESNEELQIKLEVRDEIDKEIKRLEKLRDEQGKLLAKARIIVRASLLLARSDGEKFEELEKINNYIFSRYFLTGKTVRKYCHSITDISLTAIREDIANYEIDKDFLADLYNDLFAIAYADGEVTTKEDKMISKLQEIFKLPFLTK